MNDLVRAEQLRKTLMLINEAREMGRGSAQRLHLVRGFEKIIGAAMTSIGVYGDFGPNRRGRIEENTSTATDGSSARIWAAFERRGTSFSPSIRALANRSEGQGPVAARRRDLLLDQEWYGSEYFTDYYGPCGLDDYVKTMWPLRNGRVVTISANREARDRPFAEEDRNLVAIFQEQCVRLEAAQAREQDEPRLTRRQREVLDALLRGSSEKAVAWDLGISPQTVHTHVKSIYLAYGTRSRAELLARVLSRAA
ncbi:MAG TPA: LuxR C-terminal-related transcriptional regulator [Myxococcales bacterium]|nr:LuxR C-terminal-related transcriptional regulator [Myxococcales bacterium]